MLIGITGLAGAGKSEVARRIGRKYGFTRFAFADPLKTMLASVGLTEAQLYGGEKEVVIPAFGCTPRRMMQTLGTEWGRKLVHPEIWIRLWGMRLPELMRRTGRVATDDVRFPNEVRAIRDRGGFIVKVERPGVVAKPRWGILGRALARLGLDWAVHPSERLGRLGYDFVIFNDGSLTDLERKIDQVVQSAMMRHAEAKARRASERGHRAAA